FRSQERGKLCKTGRSRTFGPSPPEWRSLRGDFSRTSWSRAGTARSFPRLRHATASPSSRRSFPDGNDLRDDGEAVACRSLGKDRAVPALLQLVLEKSPLRDRHSGGLGPNVLLRPVLHNLPLSWFVSILNPCTNARHLCPPLRCLR